MGDKYIKDGKLYEKDAGFLGGDKELGTVEKGGIFSQDTVKMNDIFTPDMKIERTGLLGENVDIVSKDTLSEFIAGKREGTGLETENHILYNTTSSYEWTQELGGAKIPKDSASSGSGDGGGGGAGGGSGSAYSSGGSSDTSWGVGRVFVLVIAGLMLTVLIGSFISTSNHQSTATPKAPPRQPPTIISPVTSNVNAYFEEMFSISVNEAFSDGNETIVQATLTNLTEKRTKVLFSSGRSKQNLNNEDYVPRPFLRDQQGNEYLAKQPAIRGQAEAFIFEDNGWGGRTTIKVGLPPNSAISGLMVFPQLPNDSGAVTLVIPGIAGWQSDLIIPSITVSAKSAENELSHPTQESDLELTRLAFTVLHGAKSQVVINRSGLAEEVTDLGVPVGVNTLFPGNGRYDKTSREDIAYFAEFSGAIPERTLFEVRLFFNGAERTFMTTCQSAVAKSRSGIFSCRTSGYYLRTGNWEVRLFVDGHEIHRTQFEIVPG